MAIEGQPLLDLPESELPVPDGEESSALLQAVDPEVEEAQGSAGFAFQDPKTELRSVETFVEGLQKWVRLQAEAVSQEEDLVLAQAKLHELMREVIHAHEELEGAAQETLALQRDLALATDRSLVLRAEENSGLERSQLLVAAHAHLRQCLCRNPAGRLWPLWSTKSRELQEYGPGISLYFAFTARLSATFFLCAILVLPLLCLNLVGNGLDNVDAGTGEHGVLAWSTLGNLQTNGTINSGPFNIPAGDFSFWAGLLDAIAMGATWAVALWFIQKTIPDAVARERKEVVTPDAYTLYISGLPRRIESHLEYEQLLKDHFEQLLNAELAPAAAKTGVEVIGRSEQFLDQPPARSCCSWQRDLDRKGRRIGMVSQGCEDQATCEVRWPGAQSQLLPPVRESLKPQESQESAEGQAGLLAASLLHRLEHAGCAPAEGGRSTVHKVSLVRDFRGSLGRFRAAVDSAQRAHNQKQKKQGGSARRTRRHSEELDEAEKDRVLKQLQELKVEELEVLGAFVTFTHVKHKEFISQEYRFSRIIGLGRWLQGDDQRFQGEAIRASDAPLPADIFWENIDCPKGWRLFKRVVIGGVFVILVLVMILCLSLAKWGREAAKAQGSSCPVGANATDSQKLYCDCMEIGIQNVLRDVPAGSRQECNSWLETFAYSQAMMMLAVVFSSVINLAAGVFISMIAHFAQPPNFTVLESRMMQMTFVVKVLTLGVVVTLVNADFQFYIGSFKGLLGLLGAGQFKDIDKAWHAAVGVEILTLFIFSIMNEVVAIAFVLLFKLKCYCLGGRKADWQSMKELFTPPQFELAANHADQLSLVFAGLLFSSCLPGVLVVLAVRLYSMYWIHKFQFLRGSSVPPRHKQELARGMARWVQVAVFCHCAVAVWVYGSETLMVQNEQRFEAGAATDYATQLGNLLGSEAAAVVEKALTPAATPNALVFCFLVVFWALKLLYWVLGQAAVDNLLAIVSWVLPCRGCFKSSRNAVFDEAFTEAPMREMIRRRINHSYNVWDADGFEFLTPDDGAGRRNVHLLAQQAKLKKQQDAAGILGASEAKAQAPIQVVVGKTSETE